MRIGHATDLHLDWTPDDARARFVDELVAAELDILVVTGDVAESDTVGHLDRLARDAGVRIAFVLGNHDHYNGRIAETQERVGRETAGRDDLVYLPAAGPVAIGDSVLVGVDGWYDGQLGNRMGTPVRLRDWNEIDDFAGWFPGGYMSWPGSDRLGVSVERGVPGAREELLARLARLGAAEAERLVGLIGRARAVSARMIVATHVPPWAGAAWYDGSPSNATWLPWMTCRAVGRAIESMAGDGLTFTVLCGHTHGHGRATIAPGIACRTGGRDLYERPRLDSTLDA